MARILALDWDHKQLHIVAANTSGTNVKVLRAVLHTEEQSPNPAEAEALGALLKERLKAADIAPGPVVICVGRDRVILKELRYPSVPAYEEPAIVRFQAVKELTDPPDEVVLDYVHAGEASADGEQRSLALIIRRELLEAYQKLCTAAGLKLIAVTPRTLGSVATLQALAGTTPLTPALHPSASVALLTLGTGWAEFCVVRDGVLSFVRSLPLSGNMAGEIKRNINVCNGQAPDKPVKALYVAGIGEHGELWEKLNGILEVPVHALDPFGGAEGPQVPATSRGGFTGAVGLIYLWAKEKGTMPINFAQPKKPRPPSNPNKRLYTFGGSIAAALFLAALIFGYVELATRDSNLRKLRNQKTDLEKELVQLDEEARWLKAIDDWSATDINWLDELYDLTDLFPDITKIRVVKFMGSPVNRGAKDKHAAQLSLQVVTTSDSRPVDELEQNIVMEGDLDLKPYRFVKRSQERNSGLDRLRGFTQQFTTTFNVEKRSPSKYTRELPPPPSDSERRRGQGDNGFGGFGGPGGFGGMGGFGGGVR